jgi:hypothetical protein
MFPEVSCEIRQRLDNKKAGLKTLIFNPARKGGLI